MIKKFLLMVLCITSLLACNQSITQTEMDSSKQSDECHSLSDCKLIWGAQTTECVRDEQNGNWCEVGDIDSSMNTVEDTHSSNMDTEYDTQIDTQKTIQPIQTLTQILKLNFLEIPFMFQELLKLKVISRFMI